MLSAVILEMVDEAVGRAVVAGDYARLFEFGQDRLGQLLAEFDAPLVEGVDVPDDALRENLVLVEGNENSERFRRQLGEQDRVGGTVAVENLVRDQFFQRVAG